jgi:uroporphyrinogen-III synthase
VKKIYFLSPTKPPFKSITHSPTIEVQFSDGVTIDKSFDTLIFTSKNGVEALQRLYPDWTKYSAISVGKGTSKEIERLGGTVLDSPELSYGEEVAKLILKKYRDRKFLYVRPEKIISKLPEILRERGVELQEATLYQTACREIEPIEERSIVIVTAPSTIKCLFKFQKPPLSTVFVAIGEKSFKAIPEEFEKYISQEQTLKSAIQFSLKLR